MVQDSTASRNSSSTLESLMRMDRSLSRSRSPGRSRSLSRDRGALWMDDSSPRSAAATGSRSKSRSGRSRSRCAIDRIIHGNHGNSDVGDAAPTGDAPLNTTEQTTATPKSKKKRSKSKKLRDKKKNIHDGGYGSDGALEQHKERVREKRGVRPRRGASRDNVDPSKTLSLLVDGAGRSKSPKGPPRRLLSSPAVSPADRGMSPMRRQKAAIKKFASMFKLNGTAGKSGNNNYNDSSSTLGTEDLTITPPLTSQTNDNSARSFSSSLNKKKRSRSKPKLKKPRSRSTGPLTREKSKIGSRKRLSGHSSVHSDTPLVINETCLNDNTDDDLSVMETLRKGQSLKKSNSMGTLTAESPSEGNNDSKRRGRSRDRGLNILMESTTAGLKDAPVATTKSRFRLQEEVDSLRQENESLVLQLEREVGRSKRLRQKMSELKKMSASSATVSSGEDGDNDAADATSKPGDGVVSDLEQEKKELKKLLQQKEKRITELEHLSDSKNTLDWSTASGHDSHGSLGSIGGDAIWNRLQAQLNETRAELAKKEDQLVATATNLALQKSRVAELEVELETHGQSTILKLRGEVQQLTTEKKELSDQLQSERREAEDRIQKKDEALIYFRNELQKLKQTSVHDQRAMLNASTHSTSSDTSSTVQRAFGGFSSLVSPSRWSKDRVNMDNASIATPRMEDD